MRKLIFLDIDGVMNSLRSAKANYNKAHELQVNVYEFFDPIAVRELNRICRRHDPDIVISSTWRKLRPFIDNFQTLRDHFTREGFQHADRIIDRTPILHKERGLEIQSWLNRNCKGETVKMVILDDDSDMVHLKPRLTRTNFNYGLTIKLASQVIKELN